MMGPRLTEAEISALLTKHPGWARDGNRLRRHYELGSFTAAFGFMVQVALVSEKLNHHPEWSNVYGRVDIAITDHAAGGLSATDCRWIEQVDRLVGGS